MKSVRNQYRPEEYTYIDSKEKRKLIKTPLLPPMQVNSFYVNETNKEKKVAIKLRTVRPDYPVLGRYYASLMASKDTTFT